MPFFLLFLFLNISLLAQSYQEIEDKSSIPIYTPALSRWKTKKIELANGLQAYLISDPAIQESGAALTINVGSWNDPDQFLGLAHYIEHLFFLGTKQHPEESDFDRFIKEHDGISYAFTAQDHSAYLFTSKNTAFQEAFKRFSQFFTDPLFNASGMERELKVVHQEFLKNLNEDAWRELLVLKELSTPVHPYHRFSTGNLETLSDITTEDVKKWFLENYSANLMRLTVISNLSLEEMTELVVKNFGEVQNLNKPHEYPNLPIIPQDLKGSLIHVPPIKNTRELTLIWELPFKFSKMLDRKPERLACYVLGHEGEGSILALLKEKHLADSLVCSSVTLGNNALFTITLELTQNGLKQLDEVIKTLYQGINLLQKTGMSRYLFTDYKQIRKNQYQYQQAENIFNYLRKIASWQAEEPLETFPEHSQILHTFDPRGMEELLSSLTPEQAVYLVSAQVENPQQLRYFRREKWMDVPYSVKMIPDWQLEAWLRSDPDKALHLPRSNPFIPQNLRLIVPDMQQLKEYQIPHPRKLVDNDFGVLYFCSDIYYQTPKIAWFFEFITPEIQDNPIEIVLADLFVKKIKDALSDLSYEFQVADLEFSIEALNYGVSLTINGYSEFANELLSLILKEIKKTGISASKFELLKESQMREYQNELLESPFKLSIDYAEYVTGEDPFTPQQKIESLKKVSHNIFSEFSKKVFSEIYIKGLLYGNLKEEQANQVWEELHKSIKAKPYLEGGLRKNKILQLSNDKGPYRVSIPAQVEGNAALLLIQQDPFSLKNRALQAMIAQIIQEPFYSALRTQQATGYIAINFAEDIQKNLFHYFLVQSHTHSPFELLARFDFFFEDFLNHLEEEVPVQRFENIKQALLISLKKIPDNLFEMGKLLKLLAFQYDADFDWITKRIEALQGITYEEFTKSIHQTLGKTNKRRVGLLIEGIGQDEIFQYHPVTLEKIEQTFEYSTK